jgi:xanthine dehydrogenase iron-sulfur cluster and FAD-binding subunit A
MAAQIAADEEPPTDQRGPSDTSARGNSPAGAEPPSLAAADRGGNHAVTVKVNGEEYTREIEPRLPLVHFLRDDLGLTARTGCDTSNCGACGSGRWHGEELHHARGNG